MIVTRLRLSRLRREEPLITQVLGGQVARQSSSVAVDHSEDTRSVVHPDHHAVLPGVIRVNLEAAVAHKWESWTGFAPRPSCWLHR